MKYKQKHKQRFSFFRKHTKLLIPILIAIIFTFSYINVKEGLSNMVSIDDLKKDSDVNNVTNSLDYSIKQAQGLIEGERGLFAKKDYKKMIL